MIIDGSVQLSPFRKSWFHGSSFRRRLHFQSDISQKPRLQNGTSSHAVSPYTLLLETNKLLATYAEQKRMADARFVFELMSIRTVVSWTIMILGYAKHGEPEVGLQLYDHMHQEGVCPNDRTFVTALKACSSLALLQVGNLIERSYVQPALKKGQSIHSQLLLVGCESNIYVQTTLVDMYAKCGCMEDTWYVFEKSPHHTTVLWNAIIAAYVRKKDGSVALNLYAQLRQECITPDDATFVSTLNACSVLVAQEDEFVALDYGRSLHQDVILFGYEVFTFVGTSLVDMYAKCERMKEAQFTFDCLEERDVVTWNVMIWGYAKEQEVDKALKLYSQMRQENLLPNEETFLGILKSCTALRTCKEQVHSLIFYLETGRNMHLIGVKRGFDFNGLLGTSLVDMYAKWGSLREAQHCFDCLQHPDVVAWTAMMSGCANNHEETLAFNYYFKMQKNGVAPDGPAFVAALKASCSIVVDEEDEHSYLRHCLEYGQVVHAQVIESRFENDRLVGNALLNFYASCGSVNDARRVFDKLPNCDVVAWTSMILAYAKQEEGDLGFELYARMLQENDSINDQTFVSALKTCCTLVAGEDESPLHGGLLQLSYLERGQIIHSHTAEGGLELEPYVGSSLVAMYATHGCMADARSVYTSLPCHDSVTYTAMISGYAKQDANDEAFNLFAQMQQKGLPRDELAFSSILKACSQASFQECGTEVHSQLCCVGLEACSVVASALIGMYSKCGNIVEAHYLFDASPSRSLLLWNSIVAGYAYQGNIDLTTHLLYRMDKEGIEPDGGTFIMLLNMCTHAGLVSESLVIFYVMTTRHFLSPTIKHCTCMIDLFGRAGLLENLVALVEDMPFQPDIVTWVDILGICVQCNFLELGKQAFDHVVSLSEKQAAAYVLLSNAHVCAITQGDQISVL